MRESKYKHGLGMGLFLAGWLQYGCILTESPDLLWTATFAGIIAGVGAGLTFWRFLDHPKLSPHKNEYLKKRTRVILSVIAFTPVLVIILWLINSDLVSRMFFTGLTIAWAITSMMTFPGVPPEADRSQG